MSRNPFRMHWMFLSACIFIIVMLLFPAAQADAQLTFVPLYSFEDQQGVSPPAGLVQGKDGNFYGTTQGGGVYEDGTVFKVTPSGALTTLISFEGTNGESPSAGLVEGRDGNFYGTTSQGGTSLSTDGFDAGLGTVFKMTPEGTITTLVSFFGGNGAFPHTSVIQGSDGNFYGTTNAGGSAGYGAAGGGTLFQMTPSGALTTLVNFAVAIGTQPSGLVQASDGNFYGTTSGGGSSGIGTVFEASSAGAFTTVADFTGTMGSPAGGLVQGNDGTLYGVTDEGGAANNGIVFKMSASGIITKITDLSSEDIDVNGGLIQGRNGDLYGTTSAGGSALEGSLFEVSSSGAETMLYSFESLHGFDPSSGLVEGTDGNFYGTTRYGGSSGYGTVFRTSSAGALTTLANFDSANGAFPNAGLVQGESGDFYGTTQGGGTSDYNYGTTFRITPTGTLTTLVDFTSSTGQQPGSGLVQGSDGNFYGTTQNGGQNYGLPHGGLDGGTVFKMTPTGVLTTLAEFIGTNGASSRASLVQGSDGNFYGTTAYGGSSLFSSANSNGCGTVFKMTPTGVVTTLVNFSGDNGAYPIAPLIQASDGNFYGTTYGLSPSSYLLGASFESTIFKMTPAGTLTTLHTFSTSDGYFPSAGVIQGSDGNFYGTTEQGGTGESGTVYKITPSGVFTTLVNFTGIGGTEPGSAPGALVQGSDGNIYGTTRGGGISNEGTIFGLFEPPSAYGASESTTENAPVTFTVAFDDPSGKGIDRIAFSKLPAHGTLTVGGITESGTTGTVTLTYRPATEYIGLDRFNYTVTGATGTSDPQSVTIAITALIWSARDVGAAADGTARILWTGNDGAAGIWSVGSNDHVSAIGPAYGPYHGWSANTVAVAADGTTRVLWTNTDSAAGIWTLDATGNEMAVGPTYGPYPHWTVTALATAPNGTSRLLWTRSDGAAGLWTLSTAGAETSVGPTYGPYPGWTAKAVGAAGDGTARILWTRTDGAAGVWTLDAKDALQTTGRIYGPFLPSHGTWDAQDLGTSSEGISQILWKRSDGAITVWSVGTSGPPLAFGPIYGPYPGWTAAALDTADDKARVLWVNSDRATSLWSFQTGDTASLIGSVYGPY